MAIVVNIDAGKEFEKLSEGVHVGVLADIVDLGLVDTQYGPKDKVRFVWLTAEVDTEGRAKLAFETFTKSLHEKATLTKRVKSILGTVPTSGQFDLDSLIGTNMRLVIQHNESKDGQKVYANVASTLKLDAKSTKLAIPRDFVRKQDKPARD